MILSLKPQKPAEKSDLPDFVYLTNLKTLRFSQINNYFISNSKNLIL